MNHPSTCPAADPAEDRLRTIEVLGALSLAADMALGLPAGHGARTTYIGMRIATRLGLPLGEQTDLFYAALLMDAGCTAWASQVAATILGDDAAARRELFFFTDHGDPRDVVRWLARYMAVGERAGVRVKRAVDFAVHGRKFMVEGMRNTTEVAARFAGRLERSPGVQQALRFAFERWDGSGPIGRRAESIPLISRIVYAAIFLEVFHRAEGRTAAVGLARGRCGDAFDPDVVKAFLRLAADEGFWRDLESERIWTLVCGLEPDSPARYFGASGLDDIARAFGDFGDLKSFYTAGHSRRVAALAERLASALGLPAVDVVTIRRAALLHDLGLVAVPSFVLHKPEDRMSGAEWEALRLHPYHGERILARVPALLPVCPIIAAHHERPDGRGYYRGLALDAIPMGARIVGACDHFDELTHSGPGRTALAPDDALCAIERESGSGFCREAVTALREVAICAADVEPRVPRREPLPAPAPRLPAWPASRTVRWRCSASSRRVPAGGRLLPGCRSASTPFGTTSSTSTARSTSGPASRPPCSQWNTGFSPSGGLVRTTSDGTFVRCAARTRRLA
ncbi:MAG TPA: HD domain-containing phosphohydrolase [Thermoanaerobaculaceae bacterium]|nr:HD domain-containing phosphohydrolase [Thermoanaerobaculaceae bacterium]